MVFRRSECYCHGSFIENTTKQNLFLWRSTEDELRSLEARGEKLLGGTTADTSLNSNRLLSGWVSPYCLSVPAQAPHLTDTSDAPPMTKVKRFSFFYTINTQTLGPLSHVLQGDASEDGAPAQQQGQQADERHQHIEELPGVALR